MLSVLKWVSKNKEIYQMEMLFGKDFRENRREKR